MKIWTLRFLAGAAALFVTAAPIAVDQGSEIVESTIPAAGPIVPCEGSKYGCLGTMIDTCVIRHGEDCREVIIRDDQCNADLPACGGPLPGGGGQT